MIQTETLADGRIHTWSDTGYKLMQTETGILYDDAVDVPGKYTYTETETPIDAEDIEDSEALRLITGVTE